MDEDYFVFLGFHLVTGLFFSLLVWYFKRSIQKAEYERIERLLDATAEITGRIDDIEKDEVQMSSVGDTAATIATYEYEGRLFERIKSKWAVLPSPWNIAETVQLRIDKDDPTHFYHPGEFVMDRGAYMGHAGFVMCLVFATWSWIVVIGLLIGLAFLF